MVEFIEKSNCSIAYDPFAGNGDMLQAIIGLGQLQEMRGLDIDPKLNWAYNDSLMAIPPLENALIITNPPYLAKYSAKRKNIFKTVEKYYKQSGFADLYQLAIYNCLMSAKYLVAIIPETFLGSNLSYLNRLSQITVLEENPFEDTENPVCVACFDNKIKSFADIKIYKNESYVCTLEELEQKRLEPEFSSNIVFNQVDGQIALRGVDSANPLNPISFMRDDELDYDYSMIKPSSRLITKIGIEKRFTPYVDEIISVSNRILENYREEIRDLLLSPFKGNQKNGTRRRRLDYRSARAILEQAIKKVNNEKMGELWL